MPLGSVPGLALSRQGVDLNYGVQVNLSGIWEEEKIFLLDAPVSPTGLFGNAVNSVVDMSPLHPECGILKSLSKVYLSCGRLLLSGFYSLDVDSTPGSQFLLG